MRRILHLNTLLLNLALEKLYLGFLYTPEFTSQYCPIKHRLPHVNHFAAVSLRVGQIQTEFTERGTKVSESYQGQLYTSIKLAT
jgi:hypothetical protein